VNTIKNLVFAAAILLSFSATAEKGSTTALQLGNPASSNCSANHGGKLTIAVDSKSGAEYGICQISNEKAFEEWCLYRNDLNINKQECPNLIFLVK
jgi:putative hemolysin